MKFSSVRDAKVFPGGPVEVGFRSRPGGTVDIGQPPFRRGDPSGTVILPASPAPPQRGQVGGPSLRLLPRVARAAARSCFRLAGPAQPRQRLRPDLVRLPPVRRPPPSARRAVGDRQVRPAQHEVRIRPVRQEHPRPADRSPAPGCSRPPPGRARGGRSWTSAPAVPAILVPVVQGAPPRPGPPQRPLHVLFVVMDPAAVPRRARAQLPRPVSSAAVQVLEGVGRGASGPAGPTPRMA